jgi:hypothetical protein
VNSLLSSIGMSNSNTANIPTLSENGPRIGCHPFNDRPTFNCGCIAQGHGSGPQPVVAAVVVVTVTEVHS